MVFCNSSFVAGAQCKITHLSVLKTQFKTFQMRIPTLCLLVACIATLSPDFIQKAEASAPVACGESLPDMIEKISPGVVNISSTTVINYQVYGMDEFMRLWGIPQRENKHRWDQALSLIRMVTFSQIIMWLSRPRKS